MRVPYIFGLMLLVLLANISHAQTIHMHSFNDVSCGAWTKSGSETAQAKAQRDVYFFWFRGFVSGYNFGRLNQQVSLETMPNRETLYLHVDKYCRENPLKPFISAAFVLVDKLAEPMPK